MTKSKYLDNVFIIIIKYEILTDWVLIIKFNGFSNLKNKGDFRVIIDYYNKK